jgi:DNA-binding NarL/FixJ family response regulator
MDRRRAVPRGEIHADIGRELSIGMSTATFHLGSLITRLVARNRVEVAVRAHETGRVT